MGVAQADYGANLAQAVMKGQVAPVGVGLRGQCVNCEGIPETTCLAPCLTPPRSSVMLTWFLADSSSALRMAIISKSSINGMQISPKNEGNSDDARQTLLHDHRRRGGGWRLGRRRGLGGGDADALSRAQHQGARPALSAICAGQCGDRAYRWRLPLYRGAGVVRRWPLPPVERYPERPDLEMGGGNRRDQRVSPPLALRQRQHA